jgi:YVTN family beta-propeller protein
MNFRRLIYLGAVFALALVAASCGDTFRPIVIPLNPNPPSGKLQHFMVFTSNNGLAASGDASRIDVSGDTNVGSLQVGLGPVHGAILPNDSEIYIANSGDDSVTAFTSTGTSTFISLPAGAVPIFLGTTEISNIYAADSGNGTVAAINTATNVATIIPLAVNSASFRPVALAETPAGDKVYVANQGNNSVSVITTSDRLAHIPIPVGMSPVWVSMRSDGRRAYVLSSGSSTISTLDTTTDTVTNTVPVSSGSNFMSYDPVFNRLYVTSNSATTVNVFDVSGDQPSALASIDLAAATNSLCTAGCVPTSIGVRADGSRAYVSFYMISGGTLNAGIAVINTGTNAITKFVSLPSATIDTSNATGCSTARFRLFVAAAADNSRVYVSECDSGNVGILDTTDDSFLLNLPSPLSAFPASTPGAAPPLQNPMFVFTGL